MAIEALDRKTRSSWVRLSNFLLYQLVKGNLGTLFTPNNNHACQMKQGRKLGISRSPSLFLLAERKRSRRIDGLTDLPTDG